MIVLYCFGGAEAQGTACMKLNAPAKVRGECRPIATPTPELVGAPARRLAHTLAKLRKPGRTEQRGKF